MDLASILRGDAGKVPGSEPLVPWWSFTKTVLAAAVLMLVGRRRLDLDQPEEGARYSIRQLLQHTSGLPDYGRLPAYHAAVASGETPWHADELLRRVRADQLLFDPGSSWAYSNIGYLFVRRIVEHETGLELGQALHTMVLEPLQVEGVFLAATVNDVARTAWGNARQYDPRWVYHGLLVGSPSAAAAVLHGLLFGPWIPSDLKAEWLKPLSVGAPLPGRPFVAPSYGLGVMIDPQNPLGRVVGHTGQGPGSTAAVYAFSDLEHPQTLSAFIDDDGANAQGALEEDILNRARRGQPRRKGVVD